MYGRRERDQPSLYQGQRQSGRPCAAASGDIPAGSDCSYGAAAAMTTPGKSTLCRAEEGAVAVEAAIALPVFLLLLLGIIEFSIAMWHAHTLLQAVSHFGRYAMVHPAACDANCIQGKVQALVPYATVPLPTVACTSNTNWM